MTLSYPKFGIKKSLDTLQRKHFLMLFFREDERCKSGGGGITSQSIGINKIGAVIKTGPLIKFFPLYRTSSGMASGIASR